MPLPFALCSLVLGVHAPLPGYRSYVRAHLQGKVPGMDRMLCHAPGLVGRIIRQQLRRIFRFTTSRALVSVDQRVREIPGSVVN